MRRPWILGILLAAALAGPVRADSGADGTRWQSVALFDWIYSGEASYTALKQAADEAQDHGWISQRMQTGQKLPQASARDLALKLEDSPSVDPTTKGKLKQYFADESKQMAQNDQAATAKRLDDLDGTLADASKRLDDLEASLIKNHYGKSSAQGLTLLLYNGFRNDSPAGLAQSMERGMYAGGMELQFMGTVDKVNYTFSLGTEVYYSNLNASNGTCGTCSGWPDEADSLLTWNNGLNYYSLIDGGASFQFPLGNGGGLDINLGSGQDLELSPLLFGAEELVNTDAFFQDVMMAYRPPKDIKTLELNYPASTSHFRGVTVSKQGAVWYWPFTKTQLVYAPDTSWWASWDPKFDVVSLRLDEDLGQRGLWLDGGLIYGMVQHDGNDMDQMSGAGLGGHTGNPNNNPALFPQHVNSVGYGTNLRFSSGTIIHLDAAASAYDWQFGYGANAPLQAYSDTAFIGTIAQPVGPLNFSLQASQVGPHFLSTPRTPARVQYGYGPGGAFQDSIANAYPYVGIQDMIYGPSPTYPVQPPQLAWISMMNNPALATNNTRQLALKGEWHGSWISAGLYDGAQMQINPTDAYVWTTPYIEGNQNDGYGWFRMFGNTFAAEPAPAPAPGQAGAYQVGGVPGALMPLPPLSGAGNFPPGSVLQQNFDLPTDGVAIYGPGPKQITGAHWQQMDQLNNYETEFVTLLSQNGLGDDHMLASSVKTVNYAGANLLFDFAALMNRNLPLQVQIVGEDRDLETAPGFPAFAAGTGLFNQEYTVGFLSWGVNDMVTILGTAGYETWHTNQSDFPVNMQIKEFGLGADLKADPFVTGLLFNFRATMMRYDDLNIGSRELTLSTVSLGSTLQY
jgi:hypothetical protein